MIDLEENDLMPEIEQQLALINQEANALENDLKEIKNIREEFELLRSENQDLKERLNAAETKHEEFVVSFKQFMKKRDDALKYLLAEVKVLKSKMSEIRGSVNPNANSH